MALVIDLAAIRAERAARYPSLLDRMRTVSAHLEHVRRKQVRLVIPMPVREAPTGVVVTTLWSGGRA